METRDVFGAVVHEDTRCLVREGDVITFGRSPDATIRLGHAPLFDDLVPRIAGEVFVARGRLTVLNRDDHLAFDLAVEGRAPVPVSPGWQGAPPDRSFEIVVSGTLKYSIAVAAHTTKVTTYEADETPPAGAPTGAMPQLSQRQRQILDAYAAPVVAGGGPATHSEVAARLNYSRATVRVECGKIWTEISLAGIPLRALPDTRDQIVDAWLRHRF